MLRPDAIEEKPAIFRAELVHAIGSLRELFDVGQVDRLQPTGPAAIYTSAVTLWMLISQRLAGLSLGQIFLLLRMHKQREGQTY